MNFKDTLNLVVRNVKKHSPEIPLFPAVIWNNFDRRDSAYYSQNCPQTKYNCRGKNEGGGPMPSADQLIL